MIHFKCIPHEISIQTKQSLKNIVHEISKQINDT